MLSTANQFLCNFAIGGATENYVAKLQNCLQKTVKRKEKCRSRVGVCLWE